MQEVLKLAAYESYYVGGVIRKLNNTQFGPDEQVSGQVYVQRMAPEAKSFPLPVVFIHGGMHTGVTWETTPDGREGWQTLFVRGGFETVVIDQAWRGRSAPDLSALNPLLGLNEEAGQTYSCGSVMVDRFDRGGGRFPRAAARHYTAQLWPDFQIIHAFAAGSPGLSDPRNQPALAELLARLGRAVLVTHSQGGDVGWKAAIANPDKVAAIVAIEPALQVPGLDDPHFPAIPVYIMWGDNLPEDEIVLSRKHLAEAKMLAAVNPNITVDDLPNAGITGNGHMLMMDDNNTDLAGRVMDWLRKTVPG